MNNRQTLLMFAIMMTASMLLMRYLFPPQQQQASTANPTAIIRKADKQFEDRKYKDSYKTYQNAAKEFKGTEHGARALLLLARAQASAPKEFRNEYAAVESYKRLVREYRDTDFREVGMARSEQLALQQKVDREQSRSWLYQTVHAMVNFGRSVGLGSYSHAFALFLIVIILKIVTWPLSIAQYKGMQNMQRVQPLVKEIQTKYKGNPQELNSKMMEVYKKEGVNPLMGCLPLLIQAPIMIFVYQVIRHYEFQFQNGVFLWINEAMHAQWSFIGANLAQPDIPLVILYTVSMFITQRITVVDPAQAEQQKIMAIVMPLMFAFFFWRFASAFLLYFLFQNIVMTLHQYHYMKKTAPATAPAVAPVPAPDPDAPTRPARSRRRRRR